MDFIDKKVNLNLEFSTIIKFINFLSIYKLKIIFLIIN